MRVQLSYDLEIPKEKRFSSMKATFLCDHSYALIGQISGLTRELFHLFARHSSLSILMFCTVRKLGVQILKIKTLMTKCTLMPGGNEKK